MSRLRPTKRKIIQLYSALLYNAQLKGFSTGQIYTGSMKNICVPGLNCYSCPGAVGACPLGALQNALASSTTRTPAYMLGIIVLLGLLLGRTICGFLCPFGLIQELLYKVPSVKLRKSRVTRALSWMKYIVLAVFVAAIPLIYSLQHFPVPAFCKYICPAGTLEGAIGLLSNPNNTQKLSMLGVLFTRKFVILVLLLTGAVFVFRIFCRFLCPLGAIYGLFCKVAMLGVRVEPDRCSGCGLCVRQCRMDVRQVGDHECINCGECISKCPAGAISWRLGSRELRPARERNKASAAIHWILALALLTGVLYLANRPLEKTIEPDSTEVIETEIAAEEDADADAQEDVEAKPIVTAETGNEPGMLIPDFTAAIYNSNGASFSPSENRGKVLVINFWATWCTPCVNELPHFERLAAEYPDDVCVVALHSSLVTEDVQAWIDREGCRLDFGLDETGNIIANLGGSTVLPMTVIVDKNGIITYNAEGSVTYEKLLGLVTEALNG